jgi:hypothetical protein
MLKLICGVLVVASVGCSAGDRPAPDGGTLDAPTDPVAACDRYLSCVLVAAPQSYAAQLQLYGDSSECWRSDEQAVNCATACNAAFQQIANQCTCTGTSCQSPSGTCTDANEPNDELSRATPLQLDVTIEAGECSGTDRDFYRFTTDGRGVVITITTPGATVVWGYLLNESGSVIGDSRIGTPESLPPGTYYIEIDGTNEASAYTLLVTSKPWL